MSRLAGTPNFSPPASSSWLPGRSTSIPDRTLPSEPIVIRLSTSISVINSPKTLAMLADLVDEQSVALGRIGPRLVGDALEHAVDHPELRSPFLGRHDRPDAADDVFIADGRMKGDDSEPLKRLRGA